MLPPHLPFKPRAIRVTSPVRARLREVEAVALTTRPSIKVRPRPLKGELRILTDAGTASTE